jgi:hypothetical protein
MQTRIVEIALQLAFRAVGFKAPTLPRFYKAEGYRFNSKEIEGKRIVVGNGEIIFHEDYADPFPDSHCLISYGSLEEFVRDFVGRDIGDVASLYATMEVRKMFENANVTEHFPVIQRLKKNRENILQQRLDMYLCGVIFRILRTVLRL